MKQANAGCECVQADASVGFLGRSSREDAIAPVFRRLCCTPYGVLTHKMNMFSFIWRAVDGARCNMSPRYNGFG